MDAKEKKQITDAVSWKNPAAEKVIKKIHKGKANPLYGLFAVGGKVLEYKADSDLRDNENVALDPSADRLTKLTKPILPKRCYPMCPMPG